MLAATFITAAIKYSATTAGVVDNSCEPLNMNNVKTVHYIYYTTLQYNTIHHTTIQYNIPHYTTLHYTTLHYTTLVVGILLSWF